MLRQKLYMKQYQKGYAAHLILILMVLVALMLVGVFLLSSNKLSLSNVGPAVKGSSESLATPVSKGAGFSIFINSTHGGWELVEYLCKDYNECIQSLDSGKRWGTVSSGDGSRDEVIVDADSVWEDYKFMKVFVRLGWGDTQTKFGVKDTGLIPSTEVVSLSGQDTVIFPLDHVSENYVNSALFEN